MTIGGTVSELSGSRMPSVARRYWCEIPVFTHSSVMSTTATAVFSDDVPAVVGRQIKGLSGPGTGRAWPIGALT